GARSRRPIRQSTTFATASAIATIAAATKRCCQNSARASTECLFDPVDRFPAREPLADAVPPGDGLLADVPAELHLFAVAEPEEVDQAEVDVLDAHTERGEPLDAGARSLREADELLL